MGGPVPTVPGGSRVRPGLGSGVWGLLLLGVCLLAPTPGAGQEARHTLILRDVPVAQALSTLATATGMDLLYGEEVTAGRRVFCRAQDRTAEEILRCIVESVDLDFYRLSSGTYVVIAAAEAAPAWGSLTGVVRDRWSGAPLPGARIGLAGSVESARANEAGLFAVGPLLPGRHNVTVFSAGYSPFQIAVTVPPRGQVNLAVALEARPLLARPIIVDGVQASRSSLSLSGVLVDGEEVAQETGGGGVLRVASRSVLGVSRRPLFADLHIQGGEAGENLIQLDGTTILNPVSVDGLLGSFGALALDRLTVRKAGFPARAGSATAGIVALEHGTGSLGTPTLDLHLDPFSANMRGSLPLQPGGWTGSVMTAVRTTLWQARPVPSFERTLREWNDVDPLLTAALLGGAPDTVEALDFTSHGRGSDLQSTDLHVAGRLTGSAGSSISSSFYRGSNDISTDLLSVGHHRGDPDPVRLMLARDGYAWTNTAGQLRWDRLVGARATLGVSVRGSRHRFHSGYEWLDGHTEGVDPAASPVQAEALLRSRLQDEPPLLDGNGLDEFAAGVQGDISLAPRHSLHLGVEAVRQEGEFSLGALYRPTELRRDANRVSVVAEDRLSRGPVTLESGLRLTWVGGGPPVAEPRLAVELEGEPDVLGPTSVRLAGGIYRQFLSQYEIANPAPSALVPTMRFWLPVPEGGEASRARHLALEMVSRPAPGWEIRAEGYWKDLPRLPAVDYAALLAPFIPGEDPGSFLSTSRGQVRGMGIRLAREAGALRIQAGYDHTHGTRTLPSRFGGDAVPSPVDVPHRVLALAESRLPHGFSLRLRGSGVWGRDWAFRRAYYDLLTLHDDRLLPDVGRPGDRTLPPLLELDAGVSWEGWLWNARVEMALDMLNLPDRRNVMDYGLRRESPDAGSPYTLVPRTLSGFTPLVTARIGF
jgi:hypothetical protein